jgi:hypothetical protein
VVAFDSNAIANENCEIHKQLRSSELKDAVNRHPAQLVVVDLVVREIAHRRLRLATEIYKGLKGTAERLRGVLRDSMPTIPDLAVNDVLLREFREGLAGELESLPAPIRTAVLAPGDEHLLPTVGNFFEQAISRTAPFKDTKRGVVGFQDAVILEYSKAYARSVDAAALIFVSGDSDFVGAAAGDASVRIVQSTQEAIDLLRMGLGLAERASEYITTQRRVLQEYLDAHPITLTVAGRPREVFSFTLNGPHDALPINQPRDGEFGEMSFSFALNGDIWLEEVEEAARQHQAGFEGVFTPSEQVRIGGVGRARARFVKGQFVGEAEILEASASSPEEFAGLADDRMSMIQRKLREQGRPR